jgi:molybdopterin converting factor small subunit
MAALNVKIKLYGLFGGSATKTRLIQSHEPGSTIEDVWQRLRSEAKPEDKIAVIDRRILLALINGTPIQYLNGWDTCLAEGDQITLMIKTAGG